MQKLNSVSKTSSAIPDHTAGFAALKARESIEKISIKGFREIEG